MAEKENSAFRLWRFFQGMVAQPENMSTLEALFNAFGVGKGKDARYQAATVARLTSLLFTELDLLTEESSRAGFSNQARKPINDASERLSPHGLVNTWQQNRVCFASCLPALLIFGEGLADEGVAVTKDELNELKSAIANMHEEVDRSGLPSSVKIFVYEQLDFILRAIDDYPIAGVKAFRTAVREAMVHHSEHHDDVEELKKTKEITSLTAIWRRVLELSKYMIDFSKLLAAGDSIYIHAGKIAHTAHDVVQHLR